MSESITPDDARKALRRIGRENGKTVSQEMLDALAVRASEAPVSNVTKPELERWANELSLQHWGVEYTGTIELTNRMWKNFNGKYISTMLDFKNPPARHKIIAMSKKRNAERTAEEVLGTLLHELVHWQLHTTGSKYRDGDFEFIAECLRVGAPISLSSSAQWAYHRYMASR